MCKLNGLTLFLHFYTLGNLKRRFHRVKIIKKIIKNVKSIVGCPRVTHVTFDLK